MTKTFIEVKQLGPFVFGETRPKCLCGDPSMEVRLTKTGEGEIVDEAYFCRKCAKDADNSDPMIGF